MTETAEMFLHNWFPARMFEASDPRVDSFRRMLQGIDPRGLAGAFAIIRDTDQRRTLRLIDTPTLVIAGEYDTVTAASHGQAIAAAIPGAELLVLPAVHLSNIEYPRQFLAAVLGFLGRRAEPARASSDRERSG